MTAQIEFIRHGSAVPDERRDELLDHIARIMSSNWRFTHRHWTRDDSPFHDDYGIAFAKSGDEFVGYSIYKRLEFEGTPMLYRAGAAILENHQCGGIYRRMSDAILNAEWKAHPEAAMMYLAWRTRNPLIWTANAKLCTAVVPHIGDGVPDQDLEQTCLQLAARLYPNAAIERPSMVMRDVYEHLAYHREPCEQVASPAATWYSAKCSNPSDAVFSVGIVRRPVNV